MRWRLAVTASVDPMSTSDPGPTTPTEPTGDDPYRGASAPDPYGQDPRGRVPREQEAYGQDPYAPAAAPRNGLGIAALVVGIVSLVLGIVPFVGVIGLVAVVLGVVALSRVRRGLATNRGVSITGIVLGALAVLAAIAWLVVTIVLVNSGVGQNLGDTISRCSQVPQAQQQQCIEDGLGLQQP